MTEINMNSVQNRFTAYLVAAVTNQRGGLGCAGGKSHWSVSALYFDEST